MQTFTTFRKNSMTSNKRLTKISISFSFLTAVLSVFFFSIIIFELIFTSASIHIILRGIYLENEFGVPFKGSADEIFANFALLASFPILTFFIVTVLNSGKKYMQTKKSIKDEKDIENILGELVYDKQLKGINWYHGTEFSSYSIIKKNIIIGMTYSLNKYSLEYNKFKVYHELSHVIARDSLVKNILINIKYLLPLIYLFWLSITGCQILILYLCGNNDFFIPSLILIVAILYIVLFSITYNAFLIWFCKLKE